MRRILSGAPRPAPHLALTAALPVVLAVVVGLLTWVAPAALAHSGLADGSPGPGDAVAPGGETVGLEFTGVDPDGEHTIALLDAEDRALGTGPAEPAGDTVVCARVAPMETGIHAVEYSVTSDDGHTVQGRYEFEVTADGEAPADLGCDPAQLAAPDDQEAGDQESLGLDTGGVAGWIWWALGAALVVSALLAVAAIVRSRSAE